MNWVWLNFLRGESEDLVDGNNDKSGIDGKDQSRREEHRKRIDATPELRARRLRDLSEDSDVGISSP